MQTAEFPNIARRIIEDEGRFIENAASEFVSEVDTPKHLLSAVCNLVNLRQRYFALAGEHFSVQDFIGITIVDTLDEKLIKNVHNLVTFYLSQGKCNPSQDTIKQLNDKLSPHVKELPQYPVGYMVLYTLRAIFDVFESITNKQEHTSTTGVQNLEDALIHHINSFVSKYVQSREIHVMRHFSDVAREYSVVLRLKCDCGTGKFDVISQTLCTDALGKSYDRLDVRCKQCNSERYLNFDLPYFKDLSGI